jgi:PAS domain S-box-containing protein
MDNRIRPGFNYKQFYEDLLFSEDYCAIYTDSNGLIKSFSKGAEQMLGYSALELIDKRSVILFKVEEELAKKSNLLSKELGRKIDSGFEVLTAKSAPGKPYSDTWTYIAKDGNKISVRLTVHVVDDASSGTSDYLLIANDVTKTNKAQKQILVYEDIVKHTSSGLYVLRLNESEEDFDFDLVTTNNAAKLLTGYDAEGRIGKKISEVIPAFMESNMPMRFKKIALGVEKGFQAEVEYGDENIKKGYYHVDVFALPNKGIGVSFENITERKQMETELINAKELAEKSLMAKDVFLANMSHEIRTPLNAIIGFTDVLINTQLNKDQQESILAVKSAGENLLAVINDILDFSKIESGKLQIENVPFHLTDILKKLHELLKIKAGEKKIELNVNLDIALPAYVRGDKVRLNQVLMNLVGNAIKFTERGFVEVSVKVLNDKDERVTILFSVKDSGIGIHEDKLEIIFDRFMQASNETTRKYGGTGLGLSISKNLVELCGGKLNVKSEVGKGSEFSFALTFEKVDEAVVKGIENKLTDWKPQGIIKILLAEDNVLNQRLAKKVVEGFGFKLDIAEDGNRQYKN